MTEQVNTNEQETGNQEENKQAAPFSEPAQSSQPPFYGAAAAKEKEQPPRRVGTITMGLCLIACGAGLCAYLIHPFENMGYLLRFAPLVLVGLGLEILISNALSKGRKLKYDILSIFISMILIGASVCAAAFSVWMDYFSPETYRQSRIVQDELYSVCYEQLKDQPVDNLSLNWSADDPYFFDYDLISAGAALDELKASRELTVNVDLKGKYESKEVFAEAAGKIIKRLQEAGVKPGTIYFWSESPDGTYTLRADGWFQQSFSARELAEKVTRYDENGEPVE